MRTLVKLRRKALHQARRSALSEYGVSDGWKLHAVTALAEILGESHPFLDSIKSAWDYEAPDDYGTRYAWEKQTWRESVGIMNAAIASYIFMNTKIQESTIANTLDSDLMIRVDHVFRAEDWTAVASLAATFVEDRFRVWAGFDHNFFGVNLMTKVLHPETGVFPLGIATGECEGWHQLGRGFVGACSNVDRHRIQSRDDLRRYAVGVLGTASLLLTQMRHQHVINSRVSNLARATGELMPQRGAGPAKAAVTLFPETL
jgi:hypothetical protein